MPGHNTSLDQYLAHPHDSPVVVTLFQKICYIAVQFGFHTRTMSILHATENRRLFFLKNEPSEESVCFISFFQNEKDMCSSCIKMPKETLSESSVSDLFQQSATATLNGKQGSTEMASMPSLYLKADLTAYKTSSQSKEGDLNADGCTDKPFRRTTSQTFSPATAILIHCVAPSLVS